MAYAVSAAASRAAFKADKLTGEPRHIQQLDPARVDERQEPLVDFRRRVFGQIVLDAVCAEQLAWELPTVAVP